MTFINIAGYKFITLAAEQLTLYRHQLLTEANENHIKGTILLSEEGINIAVAGTLESIQNFKMFLSTHAKFSDLQFKESLSTELPFKKMAVRIKNEIITMGIPNIQPEQKTADYLEPSTLKQWYDQNKDMIVLDTRNDYEVRIGTFANALDLNIENFRDFPAAIAALPESFKEKTIVTFCTGGIRCEKAGAYLLEQGFKHVYQLQGGILNYFEQCGGEHYTGDCFVFDNRIIVDAQLQEVNSKPCETCQNPISIPKPEQNQKSELTCPHCG